MHYAHYHSIVQSEHINWTILSSNCTSIWFGEKMKQFNPKSVSIISAVTLSGHSPNIASVWAKRKVRSKENNIAYSLIPIYILSRTIGLVPFSIIRDSIGRVQEARVSLFDFCWFVISVLLYLVASFFCYQNLCLIIKLPQDPNTSIILTIGDHLLIIFGLIYGAIIIAMDMYNRRRLVEILKKITVFDEEVSKMKFLFS